MPGRGKRLGDRIGGKAGDGVDDDVRMGQQIQPDGPWRRCLMEPTPIWLSANGSSASFLSGWRATTVTCPMWGISAQAANSRGGGVAIADDHRLAVLSRIHPHATCPIRVLEGELNSLHIRVVEPDRQGWRRSYRSRQTSRRRRCWPPSALSPTRCMARHMAGWSSSTAWSGSVPPTMAIKRLQKILKLRLADLVPAIRPAVKS